MNKINDIDYQIFTTIISMKQKDLLKSMYNFLQKYYSKNKIIATSHYILCEGDIPVMLVSHLDTFFKNPPINIYYDNKQSVMWSPQGLGADDRAGVFAIIKILQDGYRPCICFTTDEEIGGVGANLLIKKYPKAPFNLKYIIELDRQGFLDCVFYGCDNPKFQKFVESYYFITDWGTYSDIATICPKWGIAGVNLSIGYINEHEKIETLHMDALYATVEKVKNMLNDAEISPSFKYIPISDEKYLQYFYKYYKTPTKEYIHCKKCGGVFFKDEVIFVEAEDGTHYPYCFKCVNDKSIKWCLTCGQPFKTFDSREEDCLLCRCKKNGVIL